MRVELAQGECRGTVKKDDVMLELDGESLASLHIGDFAAFMDHLTVHTARPLRITFGRKHRRASLAQRLSESKADGGDEEEEFAPVAADAPPLPPVERARPGLVSLA